MRRTRTAREHGLEQAPARPVGRTPIRATSGSNFCRAEVERLRAGLGPTRQSRCSAAAVPAPRQEWRRPLGTGSTARARPVRSRKPHPAALLPAERRRVRAVLHERFADASPATAYFTLRDDGV
ncbi:hypothetical protein [Nonomuraea sp. NPDC050643]|uniref:hypothetical protein n=1 Tax=Nonomuraea sp. NPDC050643 TaxID=3155660 RepID=UPI0033E90F05